MRDIFSLEDLGDLDQFTYEDPRLIADALMVLGVPMICDGKEADLSAWYAPRETRPSGVIVAVRGTGTLSPPPDRVVVARTGLPAAWLKELDEMDRLSTENDHPLSGWEGFDVDATTYPRELDIALQAWRAASKQTEESGTPKQRVIKWIESNYPDVRPDARTRISVVCNWDKRPGQKSKVNK